MFSKKFIAFTTSPERQAEAANWISYGPPRRSAAAMVGVFKGDNTTEMSPHLPTTEANMKNALASNLDFWVDHDSELTERFGAWLAG